MDLSTDGDGYSDGGMMGPGMGSGPGMMTAGTVAGVAGCRSSAGHSECWGWSVDSSTGHWSEVTLLPGVMIPR